MSSHDSDEEEAPEDISSPDVCTKYQTAAEITQKALQAVVAACVDGAEIVDICALGDAAILEGTGKVYNKKIRDKSSPAKDKMKSIPKGVAFPTCVSVNNFLGHHCPLRAESKKLAAGDVVKVDLASHIDGFIAAVGHTVLVTTPEAEPVTDRRADVVHAAWTAAEAAARLVQAGKKNTDVTLAFQKATAEFECNMVMGVMSHQLKRHVIDGSRVIVGKPQPDERPEEFEFEPNEVYCIDVVVSTGEGKGREAEERTTVFKRAVETSYILKSQKARQFISQVNKDFPTLPFTIRAIADETVAKIGVSESLRHDLLQEYPVLKDREGTYVAQFKYTVLLLPSGTKKITGLPFSQGDMLKSAHSVKDEELARLLASNPNSKKAKKKKAAGEKAKAGEAAEEEK